MSNNYMDEQEAWVLVEELASKREGRPIYFKQMVPIGPMATPRLEDAARFGSKYEAMMCPAYVHALSCYEPVRVALSD